MSRRWVVLFLFFGVIHCTHKPLPEDTSTVVSIPTPSPTPRPEREVLAEILNRRMVQTQSETKAIEVFYATNREIKGGSPSCANRYYGVNPGPGLSYGICRLNVPKKSRVGTIQQTEDPRADSHLHYRIQGHRTVGGDQLATTLLDRKPESILLFVHGFNVKFEEAVLRTAQMSYDLKYQGLPMVYTWPAGAEDSLTGSLINKTYERNQQSVQKSKKAALVFLRWLKSLKVPLHLAVHSMGHQLVVPVLAELSAEVNEPFIDELILNAPDLSIDDFHQYAPSLTKVAKRVTVYCSFNDNAIAASETYNSNRRLGACATAEGIDVINVSEIDAPTFGLGLGHGYYSSRPIMTDVFQLLLGIEAEKRLFLRKSEPNSVENYYMRP